MRKSKINLLVNREDYNQYEKYFHWIRIITIFLVAIFIVITSLLLILMFLQTNQINKLLLEKQSLLSQLKNHEYDEAKLTIIENKFQTIKEFLKDDAYSYPYYNLLSSAIATSSESASLKSFDINKDRDVVFAVSFSNFGELMNFFRFVESESFLKNFEKVTLKSFATIGGDETKKDTYELNFEGRFISIK